MMQIPLADLLASADTVLEEALRERWDELAWQLIADGVDPTDGLVDDILAQQHALDRAWKAGVLQSLARGILSQRATTTAE